MHGSGFYKNENGDLLHGPNFVLNANYELRKETKDQHTYPVDGWYWFEDETGAREFFGLPPAPQNDEYIIGDPYAGNV
jgi:hypothetical protein